MQKSQEQIEVIGDYFIKPKYEVEASKNVHYLGPGDLQFLSIEPMQRGLLFLTKPKSIQFDLLEKLKSSVSIALVDFYPLAGKLVTEKFHDEHASWIYVDCNKGPGARLIHATAMNLTVSDIKSCVDVHPSVQSFFDLGEKMVNYDGHTRPLLSIQVTELLDGVFVGFTVNHSIGDGTTLWHFISTLSEIFHQLLDSGCKDIGVTISRKPIYEPFFPKGYGPILKLPYIESNEFVHRFDPGPLRTRLFRFSSEAISKLKAEANQQIDVLNSTSLQALSAFLWAGVARARNLQPDCETICSLITNYRTRLNPQLSENHVGNYLVAAEVSCKVGDLLGNGLGWAAMLVNQSVTGQDNNTVKEFLDSYVKAPYVAQTGSEAAFYKPNSVLIGGSAKFDMYGPQFGLGKAVTVLSGYPNRDDGKVTANPGCEGGGDVDLEVSLRPKTMQALELDEEFMSYVTT